MNNELLTKIALGKVERKTKEKNVEQTKGINKEHLPARSWAFCYIISVFFLIIPFFLTSADVDYRGFFIKPDASLLVFSTMCAIVIEAVIKQKENVVWFGSIIAIVSVVSYCGIVSNKDSFFSVYSYVINPVLLFSCLFSGLICYRKR